MTPAEYDALLWRYEVAVQASFAPTATLAALYVNAHLKEGSAPVEPRDFIPGMEPERPKFAPGVIPISPDEMRKRFSAAHRTKRG